MNILPHIMLRVILRTRFLSFLAKSFETLCPGQTFMPEWYLEAIAHQLERVQRGECTRLIINLPPRSLKSITVSVAWVAFLLGQDPRRRIICASYSRELARKLSIDFRAILTSPWYRNAFPRARISRAKDTQDEIEFTERGCRLAVSVGGTLTGRGGEIVILDDPLKACDASSASMRNAVNDWFSSTLLSRLDNKQTGAIIIVMQRVHMDDLSGFVQKTGRKWEVLSLPAIAPRDEDIPLIGGGIYHRVAGTALSPGREPLETLEAIKAEIGSDDFSAQYLQEPIPPGGAMVKRAWVQRYTELPPAEDHLMITQSWDTASKGGPDNDFSVCTTWLQTTDARWFLLDVWRARVDYPTLKQQVQRHALAWNARQVLVEESGTAIALLDELIYAIPGLIGVKPVGDKVTRMSAVTSLFEAKQVFLPVYKPWLADLEAELFAFPGASHDDQADSISQALQHGKENDMSIWARLAKRSVNGR